MIHPSCCLHQCFVLLLPITVPVNTYKTFVSLLTNQLPFELFLGFDNHVMIWTFVYESLYRHLLPLSWEDTLKWNCLVMFIFLKNVYSLKKKKNNDRLCCGPLRYRGLECKSRKSRATWSNRQIWPWSTKRSRSKANRVLPREHTGHSKHTLPTTQEKTLHMDITRLSIPKSGWLYSLQPKMEKLYTVSKSKTGSWLWLRYKLLIAKFRLKLKKVGKTSRSFRYDLNQIPYNYTVEVTNRFKGLDLIDRVPE